MAGSNNLKLDGGYDVEFVDENVSKQNLKCPICLLVLREPMQAVPCGHRFCKSCIDTEKKSKRNKKNDVLCPNDRTAIKQVFLDVGKQREILEFQVKCSNGGPSKCQWIGELRSIMEHLVHCPFQVLECEKKCGQKGILRKDMLQHLQDSCPNSCLPCIHMSIGCQFKGTQKDLKRHMKDSSTQHLNLQIQQQNNRISYLEAQINSQCREISLDFSNTAAENEVMQLKDKVTAAENEVMLLKNKVTITEREVMQLKKTVTTSKNEIKQLKQKIMPFQDKVVQKEINPYRRFCYNTYPFIFAIESASLEMKEEGEKIFVSESFEFLNGYTGRLRVIFNNVVAGFYSQPTAEKFIGIYLDIIPGPYDDVLEWPMLFGEVSFKCIIGGKCVIEKSFKCKDHAGELKRIFDKPDITKKNCGFGDRKFIALSSISHHKIVDEINFIVDVRKIE